MSRRSRASRDVRPHLHCESCFSRRCRAPVSASASCALTPCRLLCGAVFHLCKEDEHSLLCPNERVPCLNAAYGCPLSAPRSGLAAHLRACPASVVSCSMEWNRWPTEDARGDGVLQGNLLRERGGRRGEEEEEEEEEEALDLAMALSDQDRLFRSLKMRRLFPELTERAEEEEEKEETRKAEEKRKDAALRKEAEGAEGGFLSGVANGDGSSESTAGGSSWSGPCPAEVPGKVEEGEGGEEEEEGEERELTQEEREELARASGVDPELLEQYSAWEKMFSMEMGGCKQAGKGAGPGKGRGQGSGVKRQYLTRLDEDGADAPPPPPPPPAGGSRSKHVYYGRLEPMKIITVRTFKIPTSFTARQGRIRNPNYYRREERGVDTSDLGVGPDDMPYWEEVQASLLCSLEKELRGHLIAESLSQDALLQDVGTQTYSFLSAPFGRDMSLADLTVDKPPKLRLQLQTESVTSRHNKASSAFTFLCGHTFQRREFPAHFRNVHADIQTCVSGWFEQRCPLAYLGCTYSQRRFQPSTHPATVAYNQELSSFSLRPTIPDPPREGSRPPLNHARVGGATPRRTGARPGGAGDSLSALPYEVLRHMASFLDSLSLSQLALVSRLMREVCSSLLQERGMVTLRWEKNTCSHGGAKWRVTKKVWQFSTLFSTVDAWRFRDGASMSEHLKACPYYETEPRTERLLLLLPSVRDAPHRNTPCCKGPSLVDMLLKKKKNAFV